LCTGVESAVTGRDLADRHGNSQRGRHRSSGHWDSIGGSLDEGYLPLPPRVSAGEGGDNGGRCTGLQ
jgi:hypothetical protein